MVGPPTCSFVIDVREDVRYDVMTDYQFPLSPSEDVCILGKVPVNVDMLPDCLVVEQTTELVHTVKFITRDDRDVLLLVRNPVDHRYERGEEVCDVEKSREV